MYVIVIKNILQNTNEKLHYLKSIHNNNTLKSVLNLW